MIIMNFILGIIFAIFSTLLIEGCGRTDSSEQTYSEFPIQHIIKGEPLHIDSAHIYRFPKIYIFDTTMIIKDIPTTGGCFYDVYKFPELEYWYSFARNGRGENEILHSMNLHINNGKIYIDDFTEALKKIHVYNIGDTIPCKIVPLPTGTYYSTFTVDNYENIWILPIRNSKYRLQQLDSKGNITKETMPLPEITDTIYNDMSGEVWQSLLSFSHNKNVLILATEFGEQLDIYSEDKEETITSIGPLGPPEIGKPINGAFLSFSKLGFNQIHTTSKYIYAAFKGATHADILSKKAWQRDTNEYQKIYVYDYSGTPVKELLYKEQITGFQVVESENAIYATAETGEEYFILKYTIPN